MTLGGYCPVTLVATGERVVGKPLYWSNYDGHTYYCAHPGAAVAFMDNPARYVPAAAEVLAGVRSSRAELAAAEKAISAPITGSKSEARPVAPAARSNSSVSRGSPSFRDRMRKLLGK